MRTVARGVSMGSMGRAKTIHIDVDASNGAFCRFWEFVRKAANDACRGERG